jgi:HlyD family secretion protein
MVTTRQGKQFSRFKKWGVFLGVGAVVLASIGYYNRDKPLSVGLWKVERGIVEATVSNNRAGTVKACRRAKMSPPAGGQISKLKVKKGDRVVAGQVLLELWHKDLHAQEELAQEQFKTASSRVKEICAMASAAQRDAERSTQLKEQGYISSQLLDRSLTDAKSRQAGCEAAKGELEQSSARINLATASLERMTLRAPFSGVVADISGELGEYATPSPPGIPTLPAIDLIDDSCMFVSAPIDEVDAAVVKVGQPGRITLDAIKDKQFPGKVTRIAPYVIEIEKQARTVEVEVAFTALPREENLLVGYSADIEIVHKVRENVLRIPTQNLMEGKKVLLYKADGVLQERTVTTGLANWQYTEIVAGLQEGDQIVATLDRAGVKSGAKVKPEPAAQDVAKPAI